MLPRIAEEKDSPTNIVESEKKEGTKKHVQQKDKRERSIKCDKIIDSCNRNVQESDKSKKCDKSADCHKVDIEKEKGKKCDTKVEINKDTIVKKTSDTKSQLSNSMSSGKSGKDSKDNRSVQ